MHAPPGFRLLVNLLVDKVWHPKNVLRRTVPLCVGHAYAAAGRQVGLVNLV